MLPKLMSAFSNAIFEWVFGFHHRKLSRVFTMPTKPTKVCLAHGTKLQYSSWAMSLIKTSETPQPLASFTTAFSPAVDNLWGQTGEI